MFEYFLCSLLCSTSLFFGCGVVHPPVMTKRTQFLSPCLTPTTIPSSLPIPLLTTPHPLCHTHTLKRKLKTAPSCSTSLLTHWFRHPLMFRRPRVVLRFQVIFFYLLLGCRLHYRPEQVATVMATQPQKAQSRKSGDCF